MMSLMTSSISWSALILTMTLLNLKISRIIATSRPAFLLLPLCSLSLALAYVISQGISINLLRLVLIFLGALTAHVSVNMFNEYEDFKSGLDYHTLRTPYSGGSGMLPATPELAEFVRIGGLACFLLTALIGFYFLWLSGWGLLPVGIPGVLLIYFYTNKITHWPLICSIAPGLAFGPLMMCGAYYILSGHYNLAIAMASLIVFFLVNNLLLLNQFPDLEADKNAGRCHFPILIGRKKSAWIYAGFLVAAYTQLLICVYLTFLPVYSLLGLLSLSLAIPAVWISLQYADDMERLKPALGLNVAVTLSTPVLVAAGIIWQHILSFA
jgi:1,4-dihydroxy-2-naphthoate octaprenyltransferase